MVIGYGGTPFPFYLESEPYLDLPKNRELINIIHRINKYDKSN